MANSAQRSIFFPPVAQQPISGLHHPIFYVRRSRKHTHSVGLLWTSGKHVAEAATYKIHNEHKGLICMPSSVFEPAIPGTERPQTNAVNCTDSGIGSVVSVDCKNRMSQRLDNEDFAPWKEPFPIYSWWCFMAVLPFILHACLKSPVCEIDTHFIVRCLELYLHVLGLHDTVRKGKGKGLPRTGHEGPEG